jgi:hypothetical protein
VPRGQRDGSLRTYSRISRPEQLYTYYVNVTVKSLLNYSADIQYLLGLVSHHLLHDMRKVVWEDMRRKDLKGEGLLNASPSFSFYLEVCYRWILHSFLLSLNNTS